MRFGIAMTKKRNRDFAQGRFRYLNQAEKPSMPSTWRGLPRNHAIRLRMEKNQLRVFSSSAEKGESEDSLETTYGGDPLVIGFNSRYLLDFLKAAGGGNVRFHFKATDAPGEFRTDPTSDGDCDYTYRYIVMPVRS